MKALFGVFVLLVIAGIAAGFRIFSEGLIITDMNDKVPWGIWEAAYIFCTGLSAGSFAVSTLGLFGLKQFKSISRIAVIQAVILLVIAPVFLFLSLGRPERFYLIFLSPNPTSVISWGAYLLTIYPIVCLFYAYYLMKRDMVNTPLAQDVIERHNRRAMFWGILGVPVAIAVHGYTGVLLGFITGRALWHTALMPVLFLTSAIVSGLALLIINLSIMNALSNHKTDKSTLYTLSNLMFVFLLVDVFFLACEVLTGMYGRGTEHFEAWSVLIYGSYAWLFLGGELFLGVVIPIILLVARRKSMSAIITASLLIIIGVFAMRCNIILGGQIVQAYGGPDGHYFPTIAEWLILSGAFSFFGILYMLSGKYLPLTPKQTSAVS